MARYGEIFRNMVVARLLPPESANVGAVAKEIGVSVQTLERWREDAQSRKRKPGIGTAMKKPPLSTSSSALMTN